MHTFPTANPSGFPYYCSVHLGMMTGTVFVNSAPQPAAGR
jgi:plastocyanin